jgi:hypothetical protein
MDSPAIALTLIALLGGAKAPAAEAGATFEAKLQPKERDQLGELACTATGSAGPSRIDAQAKKSGGPAVLASVECQSHRMQHSLPVVHTAGCAKQAGKWSCDRGVDALLLAVPGAGTVAVVPYDMPGLAATRLVSEAARLTVPPFHAPASRLLKDRCEVRQRPGAAFRGASHFQIRCTAGTVELTRDCGSTPCRYFAVLGDTDTDAGGPSR